VPRADRRRRTGLSSTEAACRGAAAQKEYVCALLLLPTAGQAQRPRHQRGWSGDQAAVWPADRRFARYRSTGDWACSDARPEANASQVVATATSPPHVLEASELGASQHRGSRPRQRIGQRRARGPRPSHPTIRRSARSVQTSPQLPTSRRAPNAPTADAYPKASPSGVSRRRPSPVKASPPGMCARTTAPGRPAATAASHLRQLLHEQPVAASLCTTDLTSPSVRRTPRAAASDKVPRW
jgi:hypothetical protein